MDFWSMRTDAPVHVGGFDSGVLSVDWATTNPNLLAVGCYSGEVVVLDVDELLRDDAAAIRGNGGGTRRFGGGEFERRRQIFRDGSCGVTSELELVYSRQ